MTPDQQLKFWLEGESIHNKDRNECCPDFSCCNGKLVDIETRRAFYKAHTSGDQKTVDAMLMGFLGEAIASYCPDKKVHLTGQDPEEEEH